MTIVCTGAGCYYGKPAQVENGIRPIGMGSASFSMPVNKHRDAPENQHNPCEAAD